MDPATISLISSLLGNAIPVGLGLLAGERPSPTEEFMQLLKTLRAESAPGRTAAASGAAARGAAIGQNFQAALGNAGLGSTGPGAIAHGLAGSYAGSEAANATSEFDQRLLESALSAFSGGGFASRPPRLNQFLAGLAPTIAGGQNPFEDIVSSALGLLSKKKLKVKPAAPSAREPDLTEISSSAGGGAVGGQNYKLRSASARTRSRARFDLYNAA
jgi:hypothetical protein